MNVFSNDRLTRSGTSRSKAPSHKVRQVTINKLSRTALKRKSVCYYFTFIVFHSTSITTLNFRVRLQYSKLNRNHIINIQSSSVSPVSSINAFTVFLFCYCIIYVINLLFKYLLCELLSLYFHPVQFYDILGLVFYINCHFVVVGLFAVMAVC